MKKTLCVNNYKATTIREMIDELEVSGDVKGWTAEEIEAAATHMIMEDTDYNSTDICVAVDQYLIDIQGTSYQPKSDDFAVLDDILFYFKDFVFENEAEMQDKIEAKFFANNKEMQEHLNLVFTRK